MISMDYDDEKLGAIIQNAKILKLNVNEIKVLYCIYKAGAISQRDIERKGDLRQPEVSSALSRLSSLDLLKLEIRQNVSKGRPVNVYSLKRSADEYFTIIKRQKEREWRIMQLALDDLIKQFLN